MTDRAVKLIFGCGYLGSRVARRWRDAGDRVCVVTRSTQNAAAFRRDGFEPIVADVTKPDTLANLPVAKTVLFAVGFDRTAGLPIEQVYVGGLQAVLSALPGETGKLIYVSSTGVYAQNDGGWVDEDSVCTPTRDGGKACWRAEQLLAEHPLGGRAVILRMAGIYGPDRIPLSAQLTDGLPIPAPAEGYLNLIHVEDAANVVIDAAERSKMPRSYCVSDGHPVPRRDYYVHLAQLLGAPAPSFVEPDSASPVAARAGSNKRISNRRMLAELAPRLAYPTYREGLAAIVADQA